MVGPGVATDRTRVPSETRSCQQQKQQQSVHKHTHTRTHAQGDGTTHGGDTAHGEGQRTTSTNGSSDEVAMSCESWLKQTERNPVSRRSKVRTHASSSASNTHTLPSPPPVAKYLCRCKPSRTKCYECNATHTSATVSAAPSRCTHTHSYILASWIKVQAVSGARVCRNLAGRACVRTCFLSQHTTGGIDSP